MVLISHLFETIGWALLAVLLTIPVFALNIKFAARFGWIDWPKARGLAEEQIPIIGYGLVFLSFSALLVFSFFFPISPWVLCTSFLIAVMGYYDDRKPIPALDKLFFQLVSATSVVFLDPHIHLNMVQKYGPIGAVLSIFFIVGLVNAINFIDGIDGLAGLVILVGTFGFILLSHTLSLHYGYFLVASFLLGLMSSFLYVNVIKRKGFLGNIGSYFFSYLLAVLHLSIPLPSESALTRLSLSALCFLVPVSDSLMVILSRALSSRSPFQPDKGHLHHRLMQTNLSLRYVLLCFGLIEFIGIFAAYMLNRTRGVEFSYLPPAICLSYVLVNVSLILIVEKASRKRIQSYFQRLEANLPIYFFRYELERKDGGPITNLHLRRLEARISAEIRITDICFTESPNRLFISLSSLAGPLKGISSRLEHLFIDECIEASIIVDQGEFAKVSYSLSRPVIEQKKSA